MPSEDMFKEYSIDIAIDDMQWRFRAETDGDAIDVGEVIEGIVRQRIQKVCRELEREIYELVPTIEDSNAESVKPELTLVFDESEHRSIYSTKGQAGG